MPTFVVEVCDRSSAWVNPSLLGSFAATENQARLRAARITIVDPAHGLIVLAVWEVYADRGAIIQWSP